jgi:hypothetical protein
MNAPYLARCGHLNAQYMPNDLKVHGGENSVPEARRLN